MNVEQAFAERLYFPASGSDSLNPDARTGTPVPGKHRPPVPRRFSSPGVLKSEPRGSVPIMLSLPLMLIRSKNCSS